MTQTPRLAIKWATVDAIAELRGLDTPEQLAQAIGIDRSNLSRVRRGLAAPGPKFIASLCHFLELSPNNVLVVLAPDEALDNAA